MKFKFIQRGLLPMIIGAVTTTICSILSAILMRNGVIAYESNGYIIIKCIQLVMMCVSLVGLFYAAKDNEAWFKGAAMVNVIGLIFTFVLLIINHYNPGALQGARWVEGLGQIWDLVVTLLVAIGCFRVMNRIGYHSVVEVILIGILTFLAITAGGMVMAAYGLENSYPDVYRALVIAWAVTYAVEITIYTTIMIVSYFSLLHNNVNALNEAEKKDE